MDKRYNVYFAGQLLPGQDLTAVREKLAKLFKADQATLDKLFSGAAQLIKRDCDQATAAKYKQAMENAGARPLIKAAAENSARAPAEPAAEKPMTAAERIAALAAAPDQQAYRSAPVPETTNTVAEPTEAGDDFGLAAPGADVLRPEERPQIQATEIDTTGLAVDETAQRLSQEPPPAPSAPDTSHLMMGEVGDSIPNLPSNQAPLSPDTDSIDLAPAGTDFADCAAPDPEPPELDLSALDLAPAGTEVLDEKYRRRKQASAPDTDHLSVEE